MIETINIYDLHRETLLSAGLCASLAEAAAVCLDYHQHQQGILVKVEGDLQAEFHLIWEQVTDRMRESRAEMHSTTEDGAMCLAIMIIQRLTPYEVRKQAIKSTGIDFLLGNKKEIATFEYLARLEVSGILAGTKSQINNRMKQKIKQSMQSDELCIPAYVVIVEFSVPTIKIVKR